MLRSVCLLAAASLVSAGGNSDTTACENGPCGPGNDRCKAHTATQYVYHLSDQTCAINGACCCRRRRRRRR